MTASLSKGAPARGRVRRRFCRIDEAEQKLKQIRVHKDLFSHIILQIYKKIFIAAIKIQEIQHVTFECPCIRLARTTRTTSCSTTLEASVCFHVTQ